MSILLCGSLFSRYFSLDRRGSLIHFYGVFYLLLSVALQCYNMYAPLYLKVCIKFIILFIIIQLGWWSFHIQNIIVWEIEIVEKAYERLQSEALYDFHTEMYNHVGLSLKKWNQNNKKKTHCNCISHFFCVFCCYNSFAYLFFFF